MAQEFTFPQDQDRDDAEHFASMIGQSNLSEYVETGLGFTYDATGPSVDVGQGKAFISMASDTATTSGEEILMVNRVVQVPTQTVSLAGTALNYIYLEPNFGTDDAGTVNSYTTEQTGDILLIGTIDTSTDEVTELNRNPNLDAKSVSFGDDAESYVWEYNSDEDALTLEDDTGTRLADVTSANFDISVDLRDSAGNVIYNQSGAYVEQTRLQNDSVTVAGNAVSLGGSTAVAHADLSNIGASDHHTRYSDEEAQDATGAMAGNALTYDDATPSLDVDETAISHDNLTGVSSGDHHTRYADSEARTAVEGSVNVEDLVTASATAGHVARSQGDGTLLMENLPHGDLSGISSNDHHSRYSDEEAQDAVGTILSADFNYDDATPAIDMSPHVGDASAHHSRYADSEARDAVVAAELPGSVRVRETTQADGFASTQTLRDLIRSRQPTFSGTWDVETGNPASYSVETAAETTVGGDTFEWPIATKDNDRLGGTSTFWFVHGGYWYPGDTGSGWTAEIQVYRTDIAAWDTMLQFGPNDAGQWQRFDYTGSSTGGDHTDFRIEVTGAPSDYFRIAHMQLHLENGMGGGWNSQHSAAESGVYNSLTVGTSTPDSANPLDVKGDGDITGSLSIGGTVDGIDISAHAGDASAHHTRYSDEEAQDATGAMAGNALTYDDATPALSVDETAISHDNLTGVSAGDHHTRYSDEEAQDAVGTILSADFNYDDATPAIDMSPHAGDTSAHHAKTTTLDELNDTNVVDFTADTQANRPAAGTADRVYVETDTGRILHDNATSWNAMGVSDHGQLSGISSGDHHTRYADSEAQTAVEGSVDAADLTGASGTAGQVLESDGTNASWSSVDTTDTRVNVSDDGTQIVADATDIDFAGGYFGVTNPTGSDVDVTLTNDSVTVAGNAVALGGSTAVSHADLSNIGSSDHHVKTTSLADISDADPAEIRTGTLANRPAAGTANRWYKTTDNNGIYYDDGAAWQLIAEHPANIGAADLGFDTATQSELDSHAGTAGAHHTRYADSEAVAAVEAEDPLDLPGRLNVAGEAHVEAGSSLTQIHEFDSNATISMRGGAGTLSRTLLKTGSDNVYLGDIDGDGGRANIRAGGNDRIRAYGGGAVDIIGGPLQENGSDVATEAWVGAGFETSGISVSGWQWVDVSNHGFAGDQTGGDLAQFIADNTSAGSKTIFVLPEGTYDWNRLLDFTGDAGGTYDEDRPHTIALVGKPEATIHVDIGSTVDFSNRICFKFGNSTTGIERVFLENLHFDVGSHNSDRDAGIMTCYIEDYGYFENISISGRRRWISGATGTDSEKNGHRHTFKLDCINEDAVAEANDIRFPHGDIYESGAGSVGHAIPIAAEDFHVGTTYWRNCYVANFVDNGFYLRDGTGKNRVVSCTAVDNAAGNFRLGRNDHATNITSKLTGAQQTSGTALWVEEHRDTDPYDVGSEDDSPIVIDGFELLATGEPVNDVVRCSNNPPETVLRNGYIRCDTDDFVIDATHNTGKLTVENVSVDDSATGDTREASFRIDADNVDFRNVTYRHAPSGTSSGRSIFRFDGKRITIKDSYFLGSYLPALEVYAGADFTIENCKFPHDGSYTDPYFIRNNTTPPSRMAFRDNDISDYTGAFIGTGAISDYDNYWVEDNIGVPDQSSDPHKAASINPGTTQTFSSGTWTTVTFESVEHDEPGWTDTSSDSITVGEAGVYHVEHAFMLKGGVGSGNYVSTRIEVNGANTKQEYSQYQNGSGWTSHNQAAILQLSAGDTVTVEALQNSGSSIDQSGHASRNHLQVGKIDQ